MTVLLVASQDQIDLAYTEAGARINGRKTKKVDDSKSDLEVGANGILTEIMLAEWLGVERDARVYSRGGDKYDLIIPGTDITIAVKNRGAGAEPAFLLVPTQDQTVSDPIGVLCQNADRKSLGRMYVQGWFTQDDWNHEYRDDFKVRPSRNIYNDNGLRRGLGLDAMRDPLELKTICDTLRTNPAATIPALAIS